MSRVSTSALVLVLVSLGLASGAWADPKATYDKKCGSCHGADGHGNAKKAAALKLTAEKLDLGRAEAGAISEAEKLRITREGKGKMPAYAKSLSADELTAVTAYAASLVAGKQPAGSPPDVKPVPSSPTPPAPTPTSAATDPAAAAAAKALYTKHCASCHGADGTGNAKKATALKLEPDKLSLRRAEAAGMTLADRAAITQKGKGKMPAYGKKLGAADLEAVTAYVHALATAK